MRVRGITRTAAETSWRLIWTEGLPREEQVSARCRLAKVYSVGLEPLTVTRTGGHPSARLAGVYGRLLVCYNEVEHL